MSSLDIVSNSGQVWYDGLHFLDIRPANVIVISEDGIEPETISINLLCRLFSRPPLVLRGTDIDKCRAIYTMYSRFYSLMNPTSLLVPSPLIMAMCEQRRSVVAGMELVYQQIRTKRAMSTQSDELSPP